MIWKIKLIVVILTISVHGTERKTSGHITFEEYGLRNDDTTGPVLENDNNFSTDYNLNYNDDVENKDHQKVKFNEDYQENVDYQDINAETLSENKQIVFKDDPKEKIKETVKNPVKFESNKDELSPKISGASEVSGRIAFDDIGTDQKPDKKTRRKRRRKPKYQSYPGPINPNLMYHSGDDGYGNLGTENGFGGTRYPVGDPSYPNQYPAYPHYPSSVYPGQNPSSVYPHAGAQYPGYPVQQGYEYGNPGYLPGSQGYGLQQGLQQPGLQGYRPRKPKSLANKALAAFSEALTSIATNDDQQCVPRLLCEAAGGRASGSSSLLQSVAGLDPLLSMLSAYDGVSSSPLFVFGRAVILGMTSKGNTASCRYAYPQCPTEPDKLIHYLNNHNGGFFRFFNAPAPQQNQNVEQFYNQLAGQYGLYPQNWNQQNVGQQNQYGLVNQNLHSDAHNYGYGSNKYGFQQYRKDNIEDRIQNKPIFDTNDERIQLEPISHTFEDDVVENGQKWLFPEETSNGNVINYEIKPSRVSKTVKFPDENKKDSNLPKDYVRKGKNILFPEYNTRVIRNYDTTTAVSVNDYVFDFKHNFYVKRPTVETQTVRDDGLATVYIVRGNGDPNHPEIVKIKRGQYA